MSLAERVGSEGEEECGAGEKSSSGAAWSTLGSLAGALCVACIVREGGGMEGGVLTQLWGHLWRFFGFFFCFLYLAPSGLR